MSFNKKKLAVCLGLAMGVSTITVNVSALEVAANNVGKVLMGPIFVAQANNSTKITVANPDNNRAVKARLAFRSKEFSDEFFDFVIYLSPGDVFRGEIYGDANGTVMFKTSDDSVRNLPGTNTAVIFSDATPTDFAVPVTGVRTGDTAETGHFEVVSVYSAEGVVTVDAAGSTVTVSRGMSKTELAKIFDTDLSVLNPLNGCNTGADSTCAVLKANVESTAHIYGQAEINVSGSNRTYYDLTALAFSDENNNGIADCNIAALGGYCEKVQGNAGFDVVVGNELLMGQSMLAGAGDNIVNIERALATSASEGLYNTIDDTTTSVMVTFPTRYRHEGFDLCTSVGSTVATIGFSGPFRSDRSVPYFVSQFDNSENLVPGCTPTSVTDTNLISGDLDSTTTTTCPPSYIYPEVEVIGYDWTTSMDGTTAVPAGFENGKYEIALTATTAAEGNTCLAQYAGVPAIVKTLKQVTSSSQIIGLQDNH